MDPIESAPSVLLTKRELEVLKLISNGFSNKQVGHILDISHRTVHTHRTNIRNKLRVNNVAGMIKYAFKVGLVE